MNATLAIDGLALLGFGCLLAGCWQVYPPAALAGLGAVLVALAVGWQRGRRTEAPTIHRRRRPRRRGGLIDLRGKAR